MLSLSQMDLRIREHSLEFNSVAGLGKGKHGRRSVSGVPGWLGVRQSRNSPGFVPSHFTFRWRHLLHAVSILKRFAFGTRPIVSVTDSSMLNGYGKSECHYVRKKERKRLQELRNVLGELDEGLTYREAVREYRELVIVRRGIWFRASFRSGSE